MYKYNGKEEQKEWSVLDFDTRMHDPALGRFMGIDLLASDYSFQSPYAYAVNNPIRYIDFLGMGPGDPKETKTEFYIKASVSATVGARATKDAGFAGFDANLGSVTIAESSAEIVAGSGGVKTETKDYRAGDEKGVVKVSAGGKIETPVAGAKETIKADVNIQTGEVSNITEVREGEFASVIIGRETTNHSTGDVTNELAIGEDVSGSAFGVAVTGRVEIGICVTNPQRKT